MNDASNEQIGISASPRPPSSQEKSDDTEPTTASFGRWTGLRARLMLFVTLVLVGPLGLVGYLIYHEYDTAKNEILRDSLSHVRSLTDDDFGIGVPIRMLLLGLARNEAISRHDGPRCSQIAREMMDTETRFAAVLAAKPDGTVFCLGSPIASGEAYVGDREWFKETMASRTFSRGQYVVGRFTGRHLLVFALPAIENGEIKAVIAIGFDLGWMSNAISIPVELNHAAAKVYLLDRDGLVLTRAPDWSEAAGRRLDDPRLLDALQRDEETPVVAKGLSGQDETFILQSLKGMGNGSLYAAIGFDFQDIVNQSILSIGHIFALFAVIALAAYAIAWWSSFLLILKPARRLLVATERFRAGDHSARVGGPYGRNEIGGLARSFDSFAGAFQKILADLTSTADNLKGVIDNITEGIITADERGTILSFNPAAERITGHTAKDVIGRNVDILVPQPHRSRHDEYLASYVAGAPAKVIGRGMRRLEALHRNGKLIPIQFGIAETWHGKSRTFIGVLHDLSDQVAAEAAEQKRARDIEALFRASPAAIVALDRDAKVIWWNPSAERIFGFTAAEVLGRAHPVLPESQIDHFRDYFGRAMTGESLRDIRATRRAKGGRMVEVEFSSAPLTDAQGNTVGVVYAVSDVTDRLQLERQLMQAQKMEAVGQLTGGIAHDFNNLLGVLIGNLDLIRERVADNRETLELADAALEAGLRGAELNKRLLAFSRRQALMPEAVDVNAALADMARMLRHSLGEHIKIELHCADGIWPVRVDPVQLETAIVNLGLNARDAMPDGGTLILETRNAPLDADYAARHEGLKPGDYVMIAVSDTGEGMTSEVLARVFDPFFTTKPVGKGTGLGLSMVYGFIKQSGGHVNVYSEPGKGTTIRLYLPRDMTETKASNTDDSAGTHSLMHHELVLAVEDNPDMRRIAVRQLKELGYRVVEAENADQALVLLDRGVKPDLAFLDIIMPGSMDGLDLARHIEGRLPGVGILMTSGFTERATPEARKNEDKTIPFPILDKPYRKNDLARAVRAALDNRKDGEYS